MRARVAVCVREFVWLCLCVWVAPDAREPGVKRIQSNNEVVLNFAVQGSLPAPPFTQIGQGGHGGEVPGSASVMHHDALKKGGPFSSPARGTYLPSGAFYCCLDSRKFP